MGGPKCRSTAVSMSASARPAGLRNSGGGSGIRTHSDLLTMPRAYNALISPGIAPPEKGDGVDVGFAPTDHYSEYRLSLIGDHREPVQPESAKH